MWKYGDLYQNYPTRQQLMDIVTLILFVLGFVLLVGGADFLVRGASGLAVAAGLSPLVVGLTVVAYGTSAPELAVAVQSGFAGKSDLAVGNIVGSNISNILLILGFTAAIAPLIVSRQLVRLEIPLMIGISFLLLLMGWDGQINRLDGLILLTGAIAYTTFTIRQCLQENQKTSATSNQESAQGSSSRGVKQVVFQLAMIILSLGMLVVGSNWLIQGAVVVARLLGLSELIIGLTLVAIGTSLPELATSIAATIRGERDIVVGNAIGSNIFNILLVLGLCGVVVPEGLTVSTSVLNFDIPIMIAVAVACLPIFFTGYRIARWEGFLFLGYEVAYLLYLVLNATEHDAIEVFNDIMMIFAVPLTVITLVTVMLRALHKNSHNI